MDETTPLNIGILMLLILAPSAFGGILQGCHRHFKISNSSNDPKSPKGHLSWKELYLVAPGFGMGGGLAAVLAALWLNAFPIDNTVSNILKIIAMSTVAGFIGYRLLPAISTGLEERLNITEKRVTHTEEMVERMEKAQTNAHQLIEKLKTTNTEQEDKLKENMKKIAKANADLDYNLAISQAVAALGSKNRGDCQRGARKLSLILNEWPTDRRLNILLGRLHRWSQRPDVVDGYKEAIRVLDDYVAKKVQAGEEDEDVADALYNKACYLTQMAANVKDMEKDKNETLFNEALETLTRSIELSPPNKEDAQDDLDFKPLENNEIFRQLTSN
jgi:hypothetical protein